MEIQGGIMGDKILNETTTFCETCPKRECCPEEECVLYPVSIDIIKPLKNPVLDLTK